VTSRLLSHKQRDVLLEACAMQGPILPACPTCGVMQCWYNHTTDVWACWGCVPPVALSPLRKETYG
jgi:ribosomal protein S27E